MNTDILWTSESVEELEREFHRSRFCARKNLMSWIQFVLIFCDQNDLSYSAVTANDVMIERLNVRWLRAIKRVML
jgi:hypothetical protein